ncbi:hypothetical protein ACFL6U_26660 [Planctomycetota bacterium]
MFWKRKTTLLILVLAFTGSSVQADYVFGEPKNMGPTINSSVYDGGPCISPDGLEFYFYSFLDGWGVPTLRVATRDTTDDPWGEAVGFEAPLKNCFSPSLSADGLELYFDATRSGGSGGTDIWMATRASLSDPWADPVNLGSAVNSERNEMGPSISADGLELYFGVHKPLGGSGSWDILVSTRATVSDPWGKAENLGSTVNSSAYDGHPHISSDGLLLFISSNRSGGYGKWDIWVSRRITRDAEWSTPVNLGPNLNTAAGEAEPYFSVDGKTLYFSDYTGSHPGGVGGIDLWQASVEPIVDFDGNGNIDCNDIYDLIDQWGTDNSLYDVGPMPWGDGIVDEKDLLVLAQHMAEISDANDL